jgi:invasion protein IalB
MKRCLIAGMMVVAMLLPVGSAAKSKDLGTFKRWSAHTFTEGGASVCSMWSQPTKASGDYTRRGEIFVFVTHRPTEKRLGRVSFEMGYPFAADAQLEVTIDKKKTFTLQTSGSIAWASGAQTNESLVRHLKAGKTLVAVGTSKRGTVTTDSYSLLGFSAGYEAISKACRTAG